MSDPEIAKRCVRCGAAVRARAQFCAQCGMPMRDAAADAASPEPIMVRRKESTRIETARSDAGGQGEVATGVRRARVKTIVAADDEKRSAAETRVARVREQSRVVIDEAADDPSLRFVLVAFLIFAVFVVVLLLSLTLR